MWALDTPGANLMNFHIVTQGECVIRIDDIIYPLSAGDAVFMARDEKHTIATSNCIELPVNQWESKPMTTQIDEPSIGLVCGNITHDHPVFIRLLAQLPKVVIVRQDANSTAANIIKLLLKESKKTDSNTSFLLDRLADAIFYCISQR